MCTLEVIAEAWKIAARDLGITFIAPFHIEHEGATIHYAGLVSDFGSANGMLLFASDPMGSEPWAHVATSHGYGYSGLGDAYAIYEKQSFIDALDDWGWVPKDRQPPPWYTGKPWTS